MIYFHNQSSDDTRNIMEYINKKTYDRCKGNDTIVVHNPITEMTKDIPENIFYEKTKEERRKIILEFIMKKVNNSIKYTKIALRQMDIEKNISDCAIFVLASSYIAPSNCGEYVETSNEIIQLIAPTIFQLLYDDYHHRHGLKNNIKYYIYEEDDTSHNFYKYYHPLYMDPIITYMDTVAKIRSTSFVEYESLLPISLNETWMYEPFIALCENLTVNAFLDDDL